MITTSNFPRSSFFTSFWVLNEGAIYHQEIHQSVVSKAKRLLDIAGALVGLAITGIVLIPIAIAMAFDNSRRKRRPFNLQTIG